MKKELEKKQSNKLRNLIFFLAMAGFTGSASVVNAQIELKQEYFPDGKIKKERTYEQGSTTNFIEKDYSENGLIRFETHYVISNELLKEYSDWSKEEIEDMINFIADVSLRKYYSPEGRLSLEITVKQQDDNEEYFYQAFYDSGKLLEEGRRTGYLYLDTKIGLVRGYYESGKPMYEENYDGNRNLKNGKAMYWYETGEKQAEGEYISGTGKSINYYRSGAIRFERSFKDGNRHGLEKAFYESGKPLYEISFKEDLMDGKEIRWYETGEKQVEGEYIAGTGKSITYYRSGAVNFERPYKDGKRDGLEKSFYESGKPKYEISYREDLMDGKTIFWYETGEKQAEGSYVAGTGKTINYYRSGAVNFERSFKDGKRDGLEKSFYESGKPKYEISYRDDLQDGKEIYWYETGEKQTEGSYIAGTGKTINYYRSGAVNFERSFKDGKRDGLEKAFYESGKPEYEISYREDLMDGKEIYWYETGEKQAEGSYIAGTGKTINYYRSGAVNFERPYKDGKRDGLEKAFYESGKPLYEISYREDLKGGREIYWYETGEKQAEGNYVAGTGKLLYYTEKGEIKGEINYKDGEKEGVSKYFQYDGEQQYIEKEENFHNGMRHGQCTYYGLIEISGRGRKESEGVFYAGAGKLTVYAPVSGEVRGEHSFKEDKKDGEWKLSYSDGRPYYAARFVMGTGEWKFFYRNGAVMRTGNYFDEKLTGKWQSFYKSGQVRGEAQFSEGSGEGLVTMFYPNGSKLFEGLYTGSRFEGQCTWYYPSGAVKHTCTLVNGRIPEESKDNGLMMPDIDDVYILEMLWGPHIGVYVRSIEKITPDIRTELQQLRIMLIETIPDYSDFARDQVNRISYVMYGIMDSEDNAVIKAIDEALKK